MWVGVANQKHCAFSRVPFGESECAKTYTDDNFRIIGQARSSFHSSVLESVYIKTQYPALCKQKDFIFSLGIFK